MMPPSRSLTCNEPNSLARAYFLCQASAEEERKKWKETGSPTMMDFGDGSAGDGNGYQSDSDATVLVDYVSDPRVDPALQAAKGGEW